MIVTGKLVQHIPDEGKLFQHNNDKSKLIQPVLIRLSSIPLIANFGSLIRLVP
jgi:hypothetical protein